MKIQALDWTLGEVENFFVGLKGGRCRIDWGDGHTSVIQAHPISLFLHILDQCLIRYSLPAVSFQTIISGLPSQNCNQSNLESSEYLFLDTGIT